MKGAAVTCPPNLVLLATTSLYGVGSSQYNRLRVPLKELGVNNDGRINTTSSESAKATVHITLAKRP